MYSSCLCLSNKENWNDQNLKLFQRSVLSVRHDVQLCFPPVVMFLLSSLAAFLSRSVSDSTFLFPYLLLHLHSSFMLLFVFHALLFLGTTLRTGIIKITIYKIKILSFKWIFSCKASYKTIPKLYRKTVLTVNFCLTQSYRHDIEMIASKCMEFGTQYKQKFL